MKGMRKTLSVNKLLIAISQFLYFLFLFCVSINSTAGKRITNIKYIFAVLLLFFLAFSFIYLIYSYIKTKDLIIKIEKQYYIILFTWYISLLILLVPIYIVYF